MNYYVKLMLIFFVASSLTSLAGPMDRNYHLPNVQLAHATLPPCIVHGASGACSEPWYPAGPAMNSLVDLIFTDATAEYNSLQSLSPGIDFTDEPCTPATCQTILGSPNFLLTAPVAEQGYFELEFLLANTFWNCNFNFGNGACGVQIRQGIAHTFDKTLFVENEPSISGSSAALDNPVPTSSGGGLLPPNPCGYDTSFSQSGSNCIVGAPGGTAYHIGSSTGANGKVWLYAPGSADLNAAAQHFVNAGVATSFNSATSVLTNPVAGTTPSFFIRTDDVTRKDFGESLASQLCYLFTGSYMQPCSPWLTTVEAPITAFPGFNTGCGPGFPTCMTSVNLDWWIYTAGFSGPTFFDGSLYFGYNSRFVSGFPAIQPPNGPCSPKAVPTQSAANYMYLCNANYDSLTDQMEFSPCLTAPGDPVTGATSNLPTSPGNGLCTGMSQLSAISAGVQAEALFGSYAFTIPLYERTVQFGYLNGWTRVINDSGLGLPNHFTWLDAWNPAPAAPGTIRQGFSQTTRSVSPYIASTPRDLYVLNNIYDPLQISNPLDEAQSINWLTYTTVQLNNATVTGTANYNPPPGTVTSYRFFLRNDAFFHDGRPVTAYDVAFSYLSLIGTGSFIGSFATSMTGITILGPKQFDIGVNSLGPFTLSSLTSLPILSGRYWTGAGSSAWDNKVNACTGTTVCPKIQYRLNSGNVVCSPNSPDITCASFPVNIQQVDSAKTAVTFDPIANHVFIGSGPYTCGVAAAAGSGNCSSSGGQNPPVGGSYNLTRFGNGLLPASSVTGMYFRGSSELALWIWSEENDINPIFAVSAVSLCFGQPLNFGNCAHWQHGIGASSTGIVGINQVSAVELRYNLNWVSPFEWATNPPLGIGTFPPVLYEGSVTLNPCTIDPVNGYDC